MRILEFGNHANKKIMLIHGVNITWQMWNSEIEYFAKQYHVLVPALDGHDSEEENQFVSIEKEAETLKEFYLSHYGTEIYMVIGMSMGGAIAFDFLADGKVHAEYLIFDSGVFVSTPPLLLNISNKMQLSCKNGTKQRNQKTLENLNKAYGSKLAPYYIELADKMSDENLLAALNAIGHFQMPQKLAIENTKIIAFHGTVFMELLAKKSAKYLKRMFPNAVIKVFPGYQHGELSVNRPEEFVNEIEKAIGLQNTESNL